MMKQKCLKCNLIINTKIQWLLSINTIILFKFDLKEFLNNKRWSLD